MAFKAAMRSKPARKATRAAASSGAKTVIRASVPMCGSTPSNRASTGAGCAPAAAAASHASRSNHMGNRRTS
ncbi:hypothetical protein TBR22_A10400 [Luteitalea sp. TBR-22]|nr:hypothetical protein TBR22_A10400 [Luteitalea sp. TBR-22]